MTDSPPDLARYTANEPLLWDRNLTRAAQFALPFGLEVFRLQRSQEPPSGLEQLAVQQVLNVQRRYNYRYDERMRRE